MNSSYETHFSLRMRTRHGLLPHIVSGLALGNLFAERKKARQMKKETAQVVQQEQPSAPETTAGESKTHQSRTVEKRTVSAQPQKRAKKQDPNLSIQRQSRS